MELKKEQNTTGFTYKELSILSKIFSNGGVKWDEEINEVYRKVITKKDELRKNEITKVSKLQKEVDTLENRIEMFESAYGMIIE